MVLSHLILMTNLMKRRHYFQSYFTDEETEAQKGLVLSGGARMETQAIEVHRPYSAA